MIFIYEFLKRNSTFIKLFKTITMWRFLPWELPTETHRFCEKLESEILFLKPNWGNDFFTKCSSYNGQNKLPIKLVKNNKYKEKLIVGTIWGNIYKLLLLYSMKYAIYISMYTIFFKWFKAKYSHFKKPGEGYFYRTF